MNKFHTRLFMLCLFVITAGCRGHTGHPGKDGLNGLNAAPGTIELAATGSCSTTSPTIPPNILEIPFTNNTPFELTAAGMAGLVNVTNINNGTNACVSLLISCYLVDSDMCQQQDPNIIPIGASTLCFSCHTSKGQPFCIPEGTEFTCNLIIGQSGTGSVYTLTTVVTITP